ncbi:MAG: hypothetical protein LIO69_00255 [Oscillospiraceae bacterium]|nr:hypothetical protein [Oscillospiraceae bacterium]
MNKTELIKTQIAEGASIFEFEYNGLDGNVDYYYIQETKSIEILLWFNGEEITVYDIDSAMNTKFINGKSLAEVADDIKITS